MADGTLLSPGDLGVATVTTSTLPCEHVRRVAATLDDDVVVQAGSPLPRLWHWAFFTPEVPTALLGEDGHPRLPAGGPMAALPRRMWGGGSVRWLRPLRMDRPAERRTSVASVQQKVGRSGPLLLVTLRHEHLQDGTLCVDEQQDLVYREPPAPQPAEPAGAAPPRSSVGGPGGPGDATRRVDPTAAFRVHHEVREPTLLRYSAVTFNAHRIHYDRPYAIEVEGYPGLVVHGPLLATLLTRAAAVHAATTGHVLASIRYRAVAPAIAPDTLTVTVGLPAEAASTDSPPSAAPAALAGAVTRADGTLAMEATFELTADDGVIA